MMQAKFFFYPALVLMVGCGADEVPQTDTAANEAANGAESAAAEAQAESRGGVIPEYQLKAMEKAKNVEGELQEALEKREEEAEQAKQ